MCLQQIPVETESDLTIIPSDFFGISVNNYKAYAKDM